MVPTSTIDADDYTRWCALFTPTQWVAVDARVGGLSVGERGTPSVVAQPDTHKKGGGVGVQHRDSAAWVLGWKLKAWAACSLSS